MWELSSVVVDLLSLKLLIFRLVIEGVTATRCFSPYFIISRKTQKKHHFWQFLKYVDFSCKNEQDMSENSEFRRFCNDLLLKVRKP